MNGATALVLLLILLVAVVGLAVIADNQMVRARRAEDRADRYMVASTQAERWLIADAAAVNTASWIKAYGEGRGAMDPKRLRDRLHVHPLQDEYFQGMRS
ncbi:hypothetical protein GT347_15970 [Xylophilus rhododendri]|uniref:Uncharacterized protein n=1 Tax=Xylophilus rhododendri TaxID=2697032 RepID=A0A857J8D8_9BURK|nr:hypothetical protein [Xylophilus rhododendri]QHI99341.1 hypothetical protein GT347_15970 [Xylophilus rhododendri]